MKQALHIFLKDARQWWVEALSSAALTFGMVVVYPRTWSFSFDAENAGFTNMAAADNSLSFLGTLLLGLIPLNWWLLIARMVHAERLVGDRQFWLTRPYGWNSLLAAKALFVLVFIYVPFFIAQILLLARAGFNPGHYLAGLLLGDLWMTVILILPVIAIATVTATTARAILVVLGALMYFIALTAFAQAVPATRFGGRYGFFISSSLIACLCVAVIITQYSTRATRRSWSLLIALVFLVAVITVAAPDQAMVKRDYPEMSAGELQPLQLSYRNDLPDYQPGAYLAASNGEVGIGLPLMESGVPDGSIVIPDGIQVSFDAPGNRPWTSVWLPLSSEKFYPGQRMFLAGFNVPRTLYDRLRSLPLTLHLSVTFKQASEGSVTHLSLPEQDFPIPGFGVCTPAGDITDRPNEIRGVVCRAPVHQPALTRIETTWSDAPCGQTGTQPQPGIRGAAWEGSLEEASGSFNMVPVWLATVGFSNSFTIDDQRQYHFRHLCPGVPLTFARYNLSRRARLSLSIQNFHLPALTRGQLRVMEHPDD